MRSERRTVVEASDGSGRAHDVEPVAEGDALAQPAALRSSTADPSGGPLRRLGRAFVWPLRRFFDPRFDGLARQTDEKHAHLSYQLETTRLELVALDERSREHAAAHTAALHDETRTVVQDVGKELQTLVTAEIDTAAETTVVLGRALADVRDAVEGLHDVVERFARGDVLPATLADLDEATAALVNFALSHRGFAAQRGVWFNWPLSLVHEPGDVRIGNVNERVAEVPYAVRALAGRPAGTRVLDVGGVESTLALSLAVLGYDVTMVDPRPYPLSHPRLRVVVGRVEEFEADEPFDAVVCISTLEHIGLKAYGQVNGDPPADAQAMRRMRDLTTEGGLLVLTVPFGTAETSGDARTYDQAGLDSLLHGWKIEDYLLIRRLDDVTWAEDSNATEQGERVALVTARRTT